MDDARGDYNTRLPAARGLHPFHSSMALFSITDAQLAFGHVALLDHTDFSLEAGERVGLIGRNGTGKSSLLKIVAGTTSPDDGLIARQSGVTSAYVPQEPEFDPEQTVAEAVAMGVPQAAGLLAEYEALITSMGDSHDEDALHKLQALQSQLEAADAWQLRTRVETTIAQLGLQPGARIGSLSGGLTKRVALAQALVGAPDILLLDEPTNHLDYDSIRWLEDLLLAFRGSVLFITHDRAFLDRVATRIIELDRGVLRDFPCPYADYLVRKQQQLDAEAQANALFDKKLAQEEVWIRQGIKARRTRNEGRVRALKALRVERAQRRELSGNVKMTLASAQASGKKVIELEHVHQGYGGRVLIDNLSTTIMRGDRVGIIGPNGAGKSTLLKIMLGDLKPERGHATLGTAHALWEMGALPDGEPARFDTKSGRLTCARGASGRIEMDFPAKRAEPTDAPELLLPALGVEPARVRAVLKNAFDYLVELAADEDVRALAPDHGRLRTLPVRGVITTARAAAGASYDFVSRFFAPGSGIDEDPVTGSAHAVMTPYWAKRLGRETFTAYQASKRGGYLSCRLEGDRVLLGGQCVTVIEGTFLLP